MKSIFRPILLASLLIVCNHLYLTAINPEAADSFIKSHTEDELYIMKEVQLRKMVVNEKSRLDNSFYKLGVLDSVYHFIRQSEKNNTQAIQHLLELALDNSVWEKPKYDQLKREYTAAKETYYQILFFFSILIIFFIFMTLYEKNRLTRLQKQYENLKTAHEQQQKESDNTIELKNRKISELENALIEIKARKTAINEVLHINTQREKSELETPVTVENENERVWLINEFRKSAIYQKFHIPGSKIPTNKDWEEFINELNKTYNHFTYRLHTLLPGITEPELKMCCLIKAEISPTKIAALVPCSLSAVSMSRKRLCKKISGIEGTPNSFDQFIFSF